jgi:hypothetical protein
MQLLGCTQERAQQLWAKRPVAFRQRATFAMDQEVRDAGMMPAAQPHAIRTLARPTHHIERCNPTLRQRVSRLGYPALSQQLAHPLGAVQRGISHGHLQSAAAEGEQDMECTT